MLSHESDKTMAELETAEVRLQRGKAGSSSPRGALKRTTIVVAAFFCAGCAVLILSGFRSRLEAGKRLQEEVRSSAIPRVEVIYPKAGSTSQEIELPGTTEAFTQAPIYARTSG